jgi:hypothetical protein
MHINARVVLTDTSISIVSSRDVLITSIPLRTWIKADGNHWISRLRRPHEIRFLVKRLNAVLHPDSHLSLMKRVSQVMKELIPAAPEKKIEIPEQTQIRTTKKVHQSSSSQLMGGAEPPRRRRGVRAALPAHLTNLMLRTSSAMAAHVR